MQVIGNIVQSHYVCSCENVCKPNLNTTLGHLSCVSHLKTYNTLTSLWSSILCPKVENNEFHKRECIMGDCHRCGLQLLEVYLGELQSNNNMQWCSNGHEVVGKTTNGWDKKVRRVMYNDIRHVQLIDYLKPHLSKFVVHNFIAHWQEK
jgi:hypothetical protein